MLSKHKNGMQNEESFTLKELIDAGFTCEEIVIGIYSDTKIKSKIAAEKFYEENISLEFATSGYVIKLIDLKNAGYNLISGYNHNETSTKFDLIDIFKTGKYTYREILPLPEKVISICFSLAG